MIVDVYSVQAWATSQRSKHTDTGNSWGWQDW